MNRNSLFLLARQEGFEPPTHGLEGRCSIQLSYWRAAFFAGTVYRGQGEKASAMQRGGILRQAGKNWKIGRLEKWSNRFADVRPALPAGLDGGGLGIGKHNGAGP